MFFCNLGDEVVGYQSLHLTFTKLLLSVYQQLFELMSTFPFISLVL